jgi:hypothetical protein
MIGISASMNIKIGIGNISRYLEVGGRGGCDITAATNKDYSIIAFLLYCVYLFNA